jgi:ABC-type ATPase with predicted acetyltransferase domain
LTTEGHKETFEPGHWWLTSVILAAQETDKEDHGLKATWENSSTRPYLKKPFTKKGLVEWLKV